LHLKKLNLRKEMKQYYQPPADSVVVIRVPKMNFVALDGKGAPEDASFHDAIQTMYGLAFTIKFNLKKTLEVDYPVMPLEGLWWMKDGGFDIRKRGEWLWSLMLMQPNLVKKKMFNEAVEELKLKRGPSSVLPARLEAFNEGLCLQTMHVGPYSEEAGTIAKLEAFAKQNGYEMIGKHHGVRRRPS
jgi:hypothetical protein